MRSISRVADVSINTVSELLVEAGEACLALHDDTVRNVKASRIQCDEIWSFCHAKEKSKRIALVAVATLIEDDEGKRLIPSTLQHNRDAVVFARLIRSVALLLFAGQAIVAQAHVHAPARWVAATVVQATATSTPSSQRPDDPLTCPVCREIAHAGAYLTPGPVTLSAPTVADHWSPVAVEPTPYAGRPSHSWQSRAPPILLHI